MYGNVENEIKAGEALIYDWFGGKRVISEQEINLYKNDDGIRKIYFNNGKKIIRVK